MRNKKLIGTGVAIVTPFNKNGKVDVNALTKIVKHLHEGQVDYIVVLGTTGESVTLSVEEKQLVISTVIKVNNNKLPLVLGIGGNNTSEVIDQIKKTNLSPFEAILSVAPYYNKPNQEGYYLHYKAISKATKKDIILYNVPGRTGSNVTWETQVRIAKDFKNIVATKEASGNIEQIMKVIKNKPEQFDRAAQLFVRAVALSPLDLARLEKFAIIAGQIKPDQIMNLRHDPVKQEQTAIGFAIQATKHIEYALEEEFGITREVLNETSGESINRLISVSDKEVRPYLTRILRHLSHLHGLQAYFFKNGVHASNAIGAGCSALQIAGLPRGVAECVHTLQDALQDHSPSELLGEELPLVISILDSISKGFHVKWRLFNNQSAGRRSEELDKLCQILEAKSLE